MKYEHTVFPSQKLSSDEKNEEWRKLCVDYIIGTGEIGLGTSTGKTSFDEMQSNYDLYNGIFDEKELKHVTDPFNQEDGFPAHLQNFNIIKPKIDLLIGEESKRPDNFRVTRTSQNAVSDVQDKMKQMLVDYIMSKILSTMSERDAIDFQNKLASGEIMPPEKIASFLERDYKDISEESAYHSLRYLKERLGIQNEFNRGFADLLKSAKEVCYIGVQNGEPALERVDPRYFSHDTSPDLQFIEDGDWACRKMRMSYTEIYDRLFDKMDEKDLDRLLEIAGQNSNAGRYGKDAAPYDYHHVNMRLVGNNNIDGVNDGNIVNVWHATWKSQKKVGFLKYLDENGDIQDTIVSEDYMYVGTEISMEWKWIIEVWEGYRIGEDLYIGIQPLEYQHISADNPNSQKLPYFGIIHNSGKSLVSIMKPLQYMYIVLWYRLELAIARDKGRVPVVDITQIPKSMNIDPAKWMHYLSSVGVMFINPYEDGWDVPGREGGRPSAYNQFTELDLTMSNVIGEYVNLLAKIEDMISEISGVTRQRQGSISSNELVGNVERSVMQSAYITEGLFWDHNLFKKNVLRGLLNTAKSAWSNSNKMKLQYILDDSTRAFLELSDSFFYEDHDIFVSDSTKDFYNLESLRTLYQPAMQNGASILDIAEIMTMDNISEIKDKLRKIEKANAEKEEAALNAENERQAKLIEMQNQAKDAEIQLRMQELELSKYKTDMDNQTKISVAQIGAYKYQEDLDSDGNGVPDPIELANIAIKKNQIDADARDKEMQSQQKQVEIASKASNERKKIEASRESEKIKQSIEKQKIDLEKKKMDMQVKLQKIKDSAAMEREKLKSKTALKNKTVSGK